MIGQAFNLIVAALLAMGYSENRATEAALLLIALSSLPGLYIMGLALQ